MGRGLWPVGGGGGGQEDRVGDVVPDEELSSTTDSAYSALCHLLDGRPATRWQRAEYSLLTAIPSSKSTLCTCVISIPV